MIKKLFNNPSKSISGAALILAVASLVSRLLGIIRDRVLAGQFGAGDTLDIYYASFRIPDMIFNLLVLGALSAGFIPVLAHYFCPATHLICLKTDKQRQKGWDLVNNILNVLWFCVLIISILGFIFIPQIMKLITPGFEIEKLAMTVKLSRIMFLSPLLLTLSSVFGGVLQVHKRFLPYALAPIFYNLGIIAGAVFAVPLWGITGLAWGVVGGAFVHMFIQFLSSRELGFKYKFNFNLGDKDFKQLLTLMLPRTLTLAVSQLNLLVITIIASTLEKGSLSIFNLANNLQSFPIGIIGISFALASFPALAANVAHKKFTEFKQNFSQTLSQILFYIIPISVLMIVLNDQIVRVVLGTGKFSWQNTVLTAESLRIFCLSLFAQSLIPLFSRGFYALKNSKTPFFCALISFVLNLVLALNLAPKIGIIGLVLAFTVSSITNLMLLHLMLSKKIGGLGEWSLIKSLIKVLAASFMLALFTQISKLLIAPFLDFQTFQGIFLHGFISGLCGIVIFALVAQILQIPEYCKLQNTLKQKVYHNIYPKIPDLD